MIKKIIYGKPINTFAVTKKCPISNCIKPLVCKEDEYLTFEYSLNKDDFVYGLGETVEKFNKRGHRFVSFNSDNNDHLKNTESLYSSHNFVVVDGKDKFGMFFDTPSKIIFEIDYKKSGKIIAKCESKNLNLYLIFGDSAYDITRQFLKIIGRGFLPPIWAFGYGQSKWGYKTQKDFEKVANLYKNHNLPLDYICMDIDYMDKYKDFTIDKNRFPDIKNFVNNMKLQNINLVPIIDAGVKVEKGYAPYDEGVKNNFFCKDANGKNFEALVWPGLTHFVDFFQPKARVWFGDQYKKLTDLGFDGFWNDMNEPSIFSTEFDSDNKVSKEKLEDKQKIDDYKRFYHKINNKKVCHYDVHNVFGHLMTISAGKQLKQILKNRYLLFTRSTYIGSHRYAGIWTGDNASTWEHLKMNIYQMPALNMCGFLYSGADTGVFKGNCSRELMLRWLEFSIFTPLFRNHASRSASPQELYAYNNVKDFESIVTLRYLLLPYIYSEYMKATLNYDMFIKPIHFVYHSDNVAKTIDDQLFVGENIMISPIYKEGETKRSVYLPEDMAMVRYQNKTLSTEFLSKGIHEITMKIDEVVFFIRNNKCIPILKNNNVKSTKEIDLTDIYLLGNGNTYEQYIDDGNTKNVSKKNIKIVCKSKR